MVITLVLFPWHSNRIDSCLADNGSHYVFFGYYPTARLLRFPQSPPISLALSSPRARLLIHNVMTPNISRFPVRSRARARLSGSDGPSSRCSRESESALTATSLTVRAVISAINGGTPEVSISYQLTTTSIPPKWPTRLPKN